MLTRKTSGSMRLKGYCRTFTPVPKRIQDGSEDTLPAATISGAPLELQARTVRFVIESFPIGLQCS